MREVDPAPSTPAPPEEPMPPKSGGRREPRRHRIRRWVLLISLVALIPVAWSYVNAMRAPGSAPLSARTVEWIKDHGGSGIVVWVEKEWYSHHQPPVGGTPAGGVPIEAAPSAVVSTAPSQKPHLPPHLPSPPSIVPIAAHPLAHEGQWQVVGRTVDGLPTVRVAYLRPDTVHTSLLAGVMWMDTKLLHPVLVAGTQVPGSGTWPYDHQVPHSAYPALTAAFNSGFLLKDAGGGMYLDGRTAAPLVAGQASFVIYKNGTADIGTWGTQVHMSPDVSAVRQNLWLLVNHGRANPSLASDSTSTWGATFSGGVLVWRSGVGVTADGALVYATGPGLSASSLARILIHAGAVRAMELDINTVWTNGYFYTKATKTPWGFAPHPLLVDQYRPPTRYLAPDERDFFMMLLRPRFVPKG
jgi:Phosphodiester glycosidase